jgi:hypothetical protein
MPTIVIVVGVEYVGAPKKIIITIPLRAEVNLLHLQVIFLKEMRLIALEMGEVADENILYEFLQFGMN